MLRFCPTFHLRKYESHARFLLAQRMLWCEATGGGGQYTWSHWCNAMRSQVYSLPGPNERDHVRLDQTAHQDTSGRYETGGTSHYDELTGAGMRLRRSTTPST